MLETTARGWRPEADLAKRAVRHAGGLWISLRVPCDRTVALAYLRLTPLLEPDRAV